MLTGALIHPDIIAALSLCGHGDKILIADGNYPLGARTGSAKKIYLGLTPGLPTVTDVLAALKSAAVFEAAAVMDPETQEEPEIFDEFRAALPGVSLKKLGRFDFYSACMNEPLVLAVSTGEKRTFANILLTVGVA